MIVLDRHKYISIGLPVLVEHGRTAFRQGDFFAASVVMRRAGDPARRVVPPSLGGAGSTTSVWGAALACAMSLRDTSMSRPTELLRGANQRPLEPGDDD